MGQLDFGWNKKGFPLLSIGLQTVHTVIEDIILEVVVVRGATNSNLGKVVIRTGFGFGKQGQGGESFIDIKCLTIGGLLFWVLGRQST